MAPPSTAEVPRSADAGEADAGEAAETEDSNTEGRLRRSVWLKSKTTRFQGPEWVMPK